MASKATTPNKTLLDPVFPIPLGAEDSFVHTEETVFTGAAAELDAVSSDTGEDIPTIDDSTDTANDFEDDSPTLETPTDFFVFAQTLRRAPGGQQVVDVIVEAEDISGAINYEFNVTKL